MGKPSEIMHGHQIFFISFYFYYVKTLVNYNKDSNEYIGIRIRFIFDLEVTTRQADWKKAIKICINETKQVLSNVYTQ